MLRAPQYKASARVQFTESYQDPLGNNAYKGSQAQVESVTKSERHVKSDASHPYPRNLLLIMVLFVVQGFTYMVNVDGRRVYGVPEKLLKLDLEEE